MRARHVNDGGCRQCRRQPPVVPTPGSQPELLVGGGKLLGRKFAVAPGPQLVAHPLSFAKRPEPSPFDSRDVDEGVLRAVLRGDEPVALGCVEPLHGFRSAWSIPPDGGRWMRRAQRRCGRWERSGIRGAPVRLGVPGCGRRQTNRTYRPTVQPPGREVKLPAPSRPFPSSRGRARLTPEPEGPLRSNARPPATDWRALPVDEDGRSPSPAASFVCDSMPVTVRRLEECEDVTDRMEGKRGERAWADPEARSPRGLGSRGHRHHPVARRARRRPRARSPLEAARPFPIRRLVFCQPGRSTAPSPTDRGLAISRINGTWSLRGGRSRSNPRIFRPSRRKRAPTSPWA